MEINNFTLKSKNRVLLDNVSFKIMENKLNLFVGENGVGKTLLLDLISDLDNNRPPSFSNFPRSKEIIYQTQGIPFISEVTVSQTLKLINHLTGSKLDLFTKLPPRIKKNLDTRFGNLSGGERRFLIIWASLHIDRKLYLLDEPFANLDPRTMFELFEVIYDKIQEGKTIILVSHQFEGIDPNQTFLTLFEHQSVLFNGEMTAFNQQFGSLKEIFKTQIN